MIISVFLNDRLSVQIRAQCVRSPNWLTIATQEPIAFDQDHQFMLNGQNVISEAPYGA